MLSTLVFVLVLGVFFAAVWYAVSHEDLRTERKKPRFGTLTRALERVRKIRSSRRTAAFDHRSDPAEAPAPAVSSSAHTATEDPRPPAA